MSEQDQGFEGSDDSLMIDLSEVQEMKFEALPRGTYNAEFDSMEFKKSKSSGQPMWQVQLKITDGEYKNRKLFGFFSFSPKALPGTKTQLAVVYPELTTQKLDLVALADQQVLVGRAVRIKVDIEKYEGKDQNRIKGYMPAAAGGGFFG